MEHLQRIQRPKFLPRVFIVNFNTGLNVRKYQLPAASLEVVSLCGNGLQHINPAIFDKIKELRIIELSKNKFKEIPAKIFKETRDLVHINLTNNNLKFIDTETFQELKKLRVLDLSNNFIHTLKGGLLNGLSRLEEIYLENNDLKYIEPKALPFGFNSIKKLHLQKNRLRYIPKEVFYDNKLEVFDMSGNNVDYRSFVETVGLIDESKFESRRLALRFGDPVKKVLNFTRNRIKYFVGKNFNDTMLSTLQHILRFYTLNIRNNPLICDGTIIKLKRKIHGWIKDDKYINTDQFDSWVCHSPVDLRGENLLSIQPEQLKFELQSLKCPVACKCERRLSGLPILVECQNQNLTKVPEELPEGRVELRLDYNQIRHLTFQKSLQNVTALYVSYNNLQDITTSSFLPFNLQVVNLEANRLTVLPEDFQKLNLSTINIQNNFFMCNCKNKWMKAWFVRLGDALVGGMLRNVLCGFGGKNRGKVLVDVPDDDFICRFRKNIKTKIKTVGKLTVALIVVGLLLVFVIIAGSIYRFRIELKLLLFTRFRWHPFDRVDDSDPSMIYDAFVSYNSQDLNWVMQMTEKLENEDPCYKLCFHNRDFLPGAPICDNILDSIKTSRRMIMVLSKNFIQSQWCKFEFRIAHQEVICDRTNYLIIVLFDDIDINDLDDKLKLYLRTNTYLEINNTWFWERLRYALPDKRHENGQRQEENDGQRQEKDGQRLKTEE